MNIDPKDIIEQGMRFAELAPFEEKAHNYEMAVQAYLAASDCFEHAKKYGYMDEETKQNLRAKAATYVQQVEEIKNMRANEIANKEVLAAGTDCRADPQDNSTVDVNTSRDPFEQMMRSHFSRRFLNAETKTTFDDVIGLAEAKTALFESVILPTKFPELFQDKTSLPTAVLLYGCPGAGKTFLTKAIAAECRVTFVSVNAWEFFSRYLGVGEDIVKTIFQLARERQPSIIVFDDIDCLFQDTDETVASTHQRVRTEFLVQLADLKRRNASVAVLATMSKPWLLTPAIRRRFDKEIHLTLPGTKERAALFRAQFDSSVAFTIDDHEWMELAEKTKHYSAADIIVTCREALFRPVRQLVSATHFRRATSAETGNATQLWFSCSSEDPGAEAMTLDKIELNQAFIRPVTMSDMLAALDVVKRSITDADVIQCEQFAEAQICDYKEIP